MPTTLAEWLDHQQRVHPRAIELGLDRVRAVWQRLGSPAPAPVVVTVGGTNGKGSTVAFLEAMLETGHRVGAFTSPHLLRYSERIRIEGKEAADAVIVDAFERIERARGDIALTYFEYGTLAALLAFADARVDVALLEVGLGGRLDAVNLIDADAAIVTTVDLDHQDWLGADRDSIGREKAGIFRRGVSAIVGEAHPPRGLLLEAERIGAQLVLAQRDYVFERAGPGGWRWQQGEDGLALPMPALAAPCQLANAAAAIAALHALRGRLRWDPVAIADGVARAGLAARLQAFGGDTLLVIDVAHNPQAARTLALWLRDTPASGRTFAVFGALGDKDVRGIAGALAGAFDHWFLAGLEHDSPRGLDVHALGEALADVLPADSIESHADMGAALGRAFARARAGDRVIAFGSFFVAAGALAFAQSRGWKAHPWP